MMLMLLQMIETKVFDDINRINPIDTMTIDSHPEPVESERGRGAWLKRIFKFKRQVSSLRNLDITSGVGGAFVLDSVIALHWRVPFIHPALS